MQVEHARPSPDDSPRRVMVVYGTRPEAIKVAPVISMLGSDRRFLPLPVVTGQHREMLDQVNEAFGITPVRDLDLFCHGQTLNQLASRIFAALGPVYCEVRPDAVLVQGDTTSVMAAAIAGYYEQIPVVHLEAGLRSHDFRLPYPEEANRKIVSQVTSLHLAPTSTSRNNLLAEGVDPRRVAVTGNTVIDALLRTSASESSTLTGPVGDVVDQGGRIVLVTVHRRESWGPAVEGIGRALRTLAHTYPDDHIVFPVHRNPIVRAAVLPAVEDLPNVVICEPLPYPQFTRLLAAAHVVLTDSGGVQEEAPSLHTPVLVMRENTERPEAVEAGTVRLVGTEEDTIVREVRALMDSRTRYAAMATGVNPYGDGRAAERCVAAIADLLGVGSRVPDFHTTPDSENGR